MMGRFARLFVVAGCVLATAGCRTSSSGSLTSASSSPGATVAASATIVATSPTGSSPPTPRATPAPPPTPLPSPTAPPSGSGVEGVVQAGPTCPVERENSPCPPRPVATDVVVSDRAGRTVARTRSGDDGRFRVRVGAGQYVLKANTGGGYPRCDPTDVTVYPDRYTQATVTCDTGIR